MTPAGVTGLGRITRIGSGGGIVKAVKALNWPYAGLFLGALFIFAGFAPTTFMNADAVVYAEQIRNADFAQRTTHIGYYLIGYLFAQIPYSSFDHLLNLMNCLFGAGAVLIVALIGRWVTGSRLLGLLSGGFLAVNTVFVFNAIHAEVYGVQTFLVLLAFLLWLRGKAVLTGAAAAVAFLISPSTALAAPAFIILRPKLVPLALLVTTGTAIVVAVLLPHIDNYLFGARGMMAASLQPVQYKLAALKAGQDIFFGFYATLPLLIAGVIFVVRCPNLRRFGIATGALWLTTFQFGEKFVDVPVQLPTYGLLSIVPAIGFRALVDADRQTKRFAIFGALAIAFAIAIVMKASPTAAQFADHLPSRETMLLYIVAVWFLAAVVFLLPADRQALGGLVSMLAVATAVVSYGNAVDDRRKLGRFAALVRTVTPSDDTLVIGDWNNMVRFNWLKWGRAYAPSTFNIGRITGRYKSQSSLLQLEMTLQTAEKVWLLNRNVALEAVLERAGLAAITEEKPGLWRAKPIVPK